MLFILRQMPIGMETHHFQPNPVIHGPNPYPAVQLTGPASGTVRQPDVENDGRRQQENRCVPIQVPSQDLQGTLAIHHLQ